MERECNDCGSTEWNRVHVNDYPERRRERDRTVETIYRCGSCGTEGKHFEHNHEGTEKFSGALR